jgi:hypothetical protein
MDYDAISRLFFIGAIFDLISDILIYSPNTLFAPSGFPVYFADIGLASSAVLPPPIRERSLLQSASIGAFHTTAASGEGLRKPIEEEDFRRSPPPRSIGFVFDFIREAVETFVAVGFKEGDRGFLYLIFCNDVGH